MKTLSTLSQICKEKPLTEKVLIASSLSKGHQIIHLLAKSGTPTINLRPATVQSIAQDIAELEILKKNLKPLSHFSLEFIIEDIFQEVSKKSGSYFHGLEAGEGLVGALAAALLEIRMCNLTSKSLDPASLVDRRKGQDLKEIVSRYEERLFKEGFFDYPELLKMAIPIIASWPEDREKLYLIPSDVPFTPLEGDFLNALRGEKVVLPHVKPLGISRPSNFLECTAEVPFESVRTNSDRLKWLFAPDDSPKPLDDDSVVIFHGMGRRNEIREVFRRIVNSDLKGDDVEIIHASYDSFVPLICSIGKKFGLGITFEEGLPAAHTRPGRALSGFLAWIGSDFESARLRRLLTSGAVSFTGSAKDIKPYLVERVLIESSIGWGRNRYATALQRILKSTRERKEKAEEGYRDYLEALENSTILLSEVIESIFLEMPEPKEGTVDLGALCRAASHFISRHSTIKDDQDIQARAGIIEALDEASASGIRELPLKEALNRIDRVSRKLRIGQSGPLPGRIHVSSYNAGGRTGRAHTFLVGCEQNLFPGISLQDPMLLDDERRNLGSGLILSTERLKENLYRMASLLASLEGKITLSFSSFDVLEGKDSFPSSIILQAYRLISGNADADYTALEQALGKPFGYRPTPQECIDSADFWIMSADLWMKQATADADMKLARQSIISHYPGLSAGLNAIEARKSNRYTGYDGIIAPDIGLDPRENGRVMSATTLESAAGCPFRYFLEYVLGVYEIDELTRAPDEWLDAKGRGSVLHDIFAEFMKHLKEKREKPSVSKHLEAILKLAERIVEKQREELPAPSEAVFRQEKKEILKVAEFFLRMEDQRCNRVEPVLFEAQFGKPGEGSLMNEPVEIELGDKKILLKGRIDRIDKAGQNEYEVWDYKTGGSLKYNSRSVFDGGRELQPGLYSIAVELALRSGLDKKARVTKAGYLFPTEKGGGAEKSRQRDDRGLKEVIGAIADIMASGLFTYADDVKACRYCDYQVACGEPTIKDKYSNEENTEASLLRRLRKYV